VVWHNGTTHVIDSQGLVKGASISPNGRYLVWVRADNGALDLYDAESEETVCIVCPADGNPGDVTTGVHAPTIGDPPRVVNNEGMVFFDSTARLTSTDHNAARDVYMYQNGRLTLISPGNADFDAEFVDASANGSDVFFQTDQGLVGQDVDGETDVYDARVGGGFPSQSPAAAPAACVRSACGQSGNSPSAPMIGSLIGGSGGSTGKPRVSGIGHLSAGARARLAQGKKVLLKVKASDAGTLTATGADIVPASVEAKKAGQVSLPVRLTKGALSKLRRKGSLKVRFTIRLGTDARKAVSLTLKSAGSRKGGRS
jgi:hypothetical protein